MSGPVSSQFIPDMYVPDLVSNQATVFTQVITQVTVDYSLVYLAEIQRLNNTITELKAEIAKLRKQLDEQQ
jgi:cell division protein FtsB